jgi:predicted nucleic-acid-binding Zn-ribbon protein
MTNSSKCPKCEGTMIRGRLYTVASEKQSIDRLFGYVNWEAAEEKKFDGLYAYKCGDCGFIEFYAKKKTL